MDRGDCRTAPATPSLLKSCSRTQFVVHKCTLIQLLNNLIEKNGPFPYLLSLKNPLDWHKHYRKRSINLSKIIYYIINYYSLCIIHNILKLNKIILVGGKLSNFFLTSFIIILQNYTISRQPNFGTPLVFGHYAGMPSLKAMV